MCQYTSLFPSTLVAQQDITGFIPSSITELVMRDYALESHSSTEEDEISTTSTSHLTNGGMVHSRMEKRTRKAFVITL